MGLRCLLPQTIERYINALPPASKRNFHTPRGRTPLNVAISTDGKNWLSALALEPERGEYSYPAVIRTPDGLAHITYTWKRRKIKHVALDPAKLTLREMPLGQWPQ
ncbi:MAG: exo-alpha-sialidase [Planctomycetia bacterium]|nr:exo-alpha-sialidase [Planctomycetia bacterium]